MKSLWKMVVVAVLVTAILSGNAFGAGTPVGPVVQRGTAGEQVAQKQNYVIYVLNLTSRPSYLVTESGQRYDITWNKNMGYVEGEPEFRPLTVSGLAGLAGCYWGCRNVHGFKNYMLCVDDCAMREGVYEQLSEF